MAEPEQSLERTGVAGADDLSRVAPAVDRRARGPVAVIECFQEIPCDPCGEACTRGAIKPFQDINDLPVIDHELCDGCGVCISKCPGLAIFVIDDTGADNRSVVRIPYEFLPRPGPGSRVTALDREGRPVCEAEVVKVQAGKALDGTPVVWLAVPRDLSMTVRSFRVENEIRRPGG